MYNFQKKSKFYKIFFKAIFLIIIILVPLFWVCVQTSFDLFSSIGVSQSFTSYISHELSLTTRIFALFVSLIPTLAVLNILELLIRLFTCYENLEVFSSKVVSIYKSLGHALVYWFIAKLIYSPLITLTLSYNNPVGERFIAINIDILNILALITGAIVITIASVMQKAKEISEENDLTI
ncbi:DUF2975 domain-containing protein [Francisella uliginis]|uniref:DUF2975 domain-containing protein n=1 Tax=Francisella uliginis TaxID=573570 RepID=A0A1L4BS89_9GAMM|nr:DUF2975 domain-containing protein [Francisella uliginis]API86710.1 hypothetical protein F7310_04750 [Francisella uliginis]